MKNNQLKEYISFLKKRGYFNGSMLIARQGEILVNEGFGLANVEHRVKNTPATRFRVGSITKAFTAMSIFILQEKGFLHSDDPMNKYIKDFPGTENVTLYHLLTNTSGIPDFIVFPDYWERMMRLPSSLDQIIQSIKEKDLRFTPGSRFEYSTSNFMLLTKIIEVVSGQKYEEFLAENILFPIDMYNTGIDDGRKIVPNLANGYSVWEDYIHTEFVDMSIPSGGYGMYSTVEDLFKWDQALYTEKLVKQETLDKIFTPYLQDYGCGWAVQQNKHGRLACHFGDINGFTNDFLRYMDQKVTVIVLSNLGITPVMHLSRTLAGIVLGEPVEIPPLPDPLGEVSYPDQIMGTYLAEEKEFEITVKNGSLFITVPKMYGALYKYKLIPYSRTEDQLACYTEFVDETLTFYFGNDGGVKAMYRDCNGKIYHAEKREVNLS